MRNKFIEVFKKIDPNTDFHAKNNLDLLTSIELKVEKYLDVLNSKEEAEVKKKERDVMGERRFKARIQKME